MATSVRPRVLLTGASGRLGSYLLRELTARGLPVTAWGGRAAGELFGVPVRAADLADPDATAAAFRAAAPDVVVHAAAVAAVGDCDRDPDRAWRVNAAATRRLAELAA